MLPPGLLRSDVIPHLRVAAQQALCAHMRRVASGVEHGVRLHVVSKGLASGWAALRCELRGLDVWCGAQSAR
jgi:hypothetical protein